MASKLPFGPEGRRTHATSEWFHPCMNRPEVGRKSDFCFELFVANIAQVDNTLNSIQMLWAVVMDAQRLFCTERC